MEFAHAGEVLDCLSSERRVFPYFKHRYALILLALAAGRGRSVSELRRTRLASLLRKPVMGTLADRTEISATDLAGVWPARFESYVLTLGLWGNPRRRRRYYQISRRGVNLVLQLNFSMAHDRAYRQLLRPDDDDRHPFVRWSHPVNKGGRQTLAWVRLDIDLDEGEALIEEVQNDWVRNALRIHEELKRERLSYGTCENHWVMRGTSRRYGDVDRYVETVLDPHRHMWDEAALSAAIEFLVRDVGIREIYYHTWEGGRAMKDMLRQHPPVSHYENLPRRFCFERVSQAPRFLGNAPGHRFRRRVHEAAQRYGFWFLSCPAA
ncbi:MAG TPA: hypothetical protein VLK65_11005 [Vicinamibacteria bacterium]|nr:hypothetical protein [Vicinamibacteria bacterium]